MSSQAVMGIDPGVDGGLAVLNAAGIPIYIQGLNSRMTQREVVAIVEEASKYLIFFGGVFCFIEKVGVMPTDGRKGANTFGRIDGLLRGASLAFKLEVKDVSPMIWQSRMQCMSGGQKNITKKRAQELFPAIKMTHAIADSLLIARYGWQMESL